MIFHSDPFPRFRKVPGNYPTSNEQLPTIIGGFSRFKAGGGKIEKSKGGNMREIKFRAWDQKKKLFGEVTLLEWYIGEHEQAKNYGHKGRVSLWNTNNLDDCGSWGRWIELVDLEQFTGLKDKSGREIYEGDIVEFFEDDNQGMLVIKQVYFDDELLEFGLKESFQLFHAQFGNEFKVIGNIHENPELLK